jgi:hypothetical protein
LRANQESGRAVAPSRRRERAAGEDSETVSAARQAQTLPPDSSAE